MDTAASATDLQTCVKILFSRLICNVPEIQPLLPQVIFISANLLSHATLAIIQDELPHNVFVKRLPSGWNNTK